jgi:hypothetical protein
MRACSDLSLRRVAFFLLTCNLSGKQALHQKGKRGESVMTLCVCRKRNRQYTHLSCLRVVYSLGLVSFTIIASFNSSLLTPTFFLQLSLTPGAHFSNMFLSPRGIAPHRLNNVWISGGKVTVVLTHQAGTCGHVFVVRPYVNGTLW